MRACDRCDGVSGRCGYCGDTGIIEESAEGEFVELNPNALRDLNGRRYRRLRVAQNFPATAKQRVGRKKTVSGVTNPPKRKPSTRLADIVHQPSPGFRYCPFCRCTVKSSRLIRHAVEKCPKRPEISLAVKNRLLGPSKAQRELRSTPFRPLNNAQSLSATALKDSRRVEKAKAQNALAANSSDAIGNTGTSGTDVMREAFFQEIYDRLDATKGQGQMFRDNGSFGSHPAHDNFDDESFS